MAGDPHPKPPKRPKRRVRRGRDPEATASAHAASDECFACGRSGVALAAHHVLYGGSARYRVDALRNLILLCQTAQNAAGDSVEGCHQRLHASDPVTKQRIGDRLRRDRPDIIRYVCECLGDVQGISYLERRYSLPT